MSTISAAEIKKRGIQAFEPAIRDNGEAVITVRGEGRYVIMNMVKYNLLREAELDLAVREGRADYKAGRIADKNVKGHMKRLDDAV